MFFLNVNVLIPNGAQSYLILFLEVQNKNYVSSDGMQSPFISALFLPIQLPTFQLQ